MTQTATVNVTDRARTFRRVCALRGTAVDAGVLFTALVRQSSSHDRHIKRAKLTLRKDKLVWTIFAELH